MCKAIHSQHQILKLDFKPECEIQLFKDQIEFQNLAENKECLKH